MSYITDFRDDDYDDPALPHHTMESLDDYFIKGFEPGGFLVSMLAEDYGAALGKADLENAPRFHNIATWLKTYAPQGSTGSKKAVVNWCNDKDGIRSAYREEAEKAYEWRMLGGERV